MGRKDGSQVGGKRCVRTLDVVRREKQLTGEEEEAEE